MIDRAALDRWMAAAADGDRTAVAPLFHALWPVVVRYAARLVGDATLAEDCAQDALVQLFGQLDRYDRGRDALTWALTLTTWQVRSVRRRRARRGELDPGPRAADPERETADPGSLDGASFVEHRDLVRAALAALESLGPRDLETITLAVTDADRAVAPATFRKRLERALGRFRTSWRSRHGTL
ncbi:MAG TPA: sigma-70 family RNA polymerase sigma factor [Kofleriaceae bacterium]|jgi:RNA polymerase sigma-70 factor (ECF subfamily)|nr:sigma-70 family RNA polymerase sigma factor [Kofleriaceae bacterium]